MTNTLPIQQDIPLKRAETEMCFFKMAAKIKKEKPSTTTIPDQYRTF
jgi:hypothetical protein